MTWVAHYKVIKSGRIIIERRKRAESLPRRKVIAGERCIRVGGVHRDRSR